MTNDTRREVSPPRIARILLRWVTARRNCEFQMGDLEEEFQDIVDTSAGLRGARRWYWKQVWEYFAGSEAPKAVQRITNPNRAGFFDGLSQSFRYAIRSLARAPGFVAAAVLTLALGIGPNTAIFSIVDAVLLRPMHFRNSHQLVVLWETDKSDGNQPWRVAPSNFLDWKEQASAFQDVAAFGAFSANWSGDREPMQLKGSRVTSNYFSVLGVQPVLGRSFVSADETSGSVIIVGYDFWRTHLAGGENAIGSAMVLDGAPFTIIGVMPRGIYPSWPVNGPRIHFQSEYQDVWSLLPSSAMTSRRSHVLGVVARMKPETTLAGAQQQMDTIALRLEQEYAENRQEGALVRPLMDEVAGAIRPALLILFAAVGSVLLIACSNVAGLSLARLASRRHEIAVRAALGAGRFTIAGQFLIEGLLLALLASVVGILFAYESHQLLLRLIPQEIPRLADVHLHGRVLMFTLGISFLAAIISTLAPAWVGLRLNIAGALKETSRGNESMPSQRLRRFLVVTQVGLAVVLTLSAGLLARSFYRLKQINPGFRPERLMVAEIVLPDSKYDTWQKIQTFYLLLLERIEQLPDIQSASIAYDHPLEENWLTGFSLEGEPGESWTVQLRIVSPGYFAGVGPALLEGRELNRDDDAAHPGAAIVNESFRRRYLSGGDAVGRKILCTAASSNWNRDMPDRFEIVGVVADVQPPGLGARTEPFLYLSSWQYPRWDMKLLVRAQADSPAATAAAIRGAVARLDSQLPISKFTTMETVMSRAVAQPRFNMMLMVLFCALALILALVGIYGLIAYWVAARRREIGMRVALGARPFNVILLVFHQGVKLVVTGVVFGTLITAVVSRLLQSQLFGISAIDPLTYAFLPVVVLTVGLAACVIPARAASRVDPMIALREE